MSASPVKFLFIFFSICITLWTIFIFASKLVAWILSWKVGASIEFRVGGCKSLRDIVVKFKKGPVESLSVGEISLNVRQSLARIGFGFVPRDPKVHIIICDLEVVLRNSIKTNKNTKSRKSHSGSGRGTWKVVANIARFFSVSVTDFVVKAPTATVEVKELRADITKNGASEPILFLQLYLLPIFVYTAESHVCCEQIPGTGNGSCHMVGQEPYSSTKRSPASVTVEEISFSLEFGHERDKGIIIKNCDIISGEVIVNLTEDIFVKNRSSDALSNQDRVMLDAKNTVDKKTPKKNSQNSISKSISLFPEKVCFSLPKLDVKFSHTEYNLNLQNNVMGIQLRSNKYRFTDDVRECTRVDVQMECSEIHILREQNNSLLDVLKLDVSGFVCTPTQLNYQTRAEIDVSLGGTQSNIVISRLTPWLKLYFSRKKKSVPREESSISKEISSDESKNIMWTCTVSAPEMGIDLYSIDNSTLFHASSQYSHMFASNISHSRTSAHMELGELNLNMVDEYDDTLKECLFNVETNTNSLIHVTKISLDLGRKEMDNLEEKTAFSVDVMGMRVYASLQQIESFIYTVLSFQSLFKRMAPVKIKTQNQGVHLPKESKMGIKLFKFNLEKCCVNLFGEMDMENKAVEDLKRVNFGSQGGRVVVSVLPDGTPRLANITTTDPNVKNKLKYSLVLEMHHSSVLINKDKKSHQILLERARFIYNESLGEHRYSTEVVIFDIKNAKFVHRSAALKDVSVCSYFSSSDVAMRWEPDMHITLVDVALRLKTAIQNKKLQELTGDVGIKEKPVSESSYFQKQKKKTESIFAVDVETLQICADVGDGVAARVLVRSIFSENARIGILLEGFSVFLNDSKVMESGRMQVSHIPTPAVSCDVKRSESTPWDWVVQGFDLRICMPFRLQLRAIEDSVEDMLRCLKLVTAEKQKLIFPTKNSSKSKKTSTVNPGRIRICIRKITAYIEEEPIQGWLDQHYHLLKNEACELAVRLKYLDDLVGNEKTSDEVNGSTNERSFCWNGVTVDVDDNSVIDQIKEEIYRRSFNSYYSVCQKLVPAEFSGASSNEFQAGFKFSSSRTSLLSLSATELDVSLSEIDGGDSGMIEVLQKLDPICAENKIPFSRLLGRNINLSTGTLMARIRDYTFPLFSGVTGNCKGCVVLAQQATYFPQQIRQEVFLGRWRKLSILRSASGTTPPMKVYMDLPLNFQKSEVSFGVGYEPTFADISYAFTVALARANLSIRSSSLPPQPLEKEQSQTQKKERSLPWWDEVRNYIHGTATLFFAETRWIVLGSTDPYEKTEMLQISSRCMKIVQSEGRVHATATDLKIFVSSLESMAKNQGLKIPPNVLGPLLEVPSFTLDVTMEWECDSETPLNHYLYALPNECGSRIKVYDPFRSTSLSLKWNFLLRPCDLTHGRRSPSSSSPNAAISSENGGTSPHCNGVINSPVLTIGAHDLAWLIKFWNINYLPPHKLRMFSRWPRFHVPRITRSGNLSLDRVMTEFMLRIDASPTCMKHNPLHDDDPAKGLNFKMTKLKYEAYYGRGKQKFTFESKRDPLDIVYQGIDFHLPKVYLNKVNGASVSELIQAKRASMNGGDGDKFHHNLSSEKPEDDKFLLSSDYFTIRKQAPKADAEKLLAWQEAGRKNPEMTYVRSEHENLSDSDEHTRSEQSDDDGFNVVIADSCQRVFVYGLKLLWTIENRDAVWSWVGGIFKVFEAPKPSPSRQYAQRKVVESQASVVQNASNNPPLSSQCKDSAQVSSESHSVDAESTQSGITEKKGPIVDSEVEGVRHFMVNVIEPQFNLHSEEANGRFLLAAVSGRVLARSFHSVLHVGSEMIEQLGTGTVQIPETQPEMTWTHTELSVMLEHVQAHVAPTDVDPGAGVQWLPKILRSSPKVKRTGALLERVFMPCDMYFRYTRHKGGTADLKVKPLKEVTFNSHNITATMTSRQFQVMLDVLSILLFPQQMRPRRSSLSYTDDDEDVEEEADEMVPDGVEEVESARVELEHSEWKVNLLLRDIMKLSASIKSCAEPSSQKCNLWMTGEKLALVNGMKKELVSARKCRKSASLFLRRALQKAAQLRLMEKEKNKSPSYAMCISMQIKKVVWGMLVDGKPFAEAEISDMIFGFQRDYKDVGVAKFTTKYCMVRNCLLNAKSDMLLSPWNPPSEWGKNVMIRVDARQGPPKDGNSPFELFQVEVYPLKIHLTETMHRMMWTYFFPEEENDSQKRQEVWKVSTTASSRRVKKASSVHDSSFSFSQTRDPESSHKSAGNPSSSSTDASAQGSKSQSMKPNAGGGPGAELRRTASFDRTWEENLAESVANELIMCQQEDHSRKSKDSKPLKSGRTSHEEKRVVKVHDDKRPRPPRKTRDFYNIKISQVEVLVTYEGSRVAVSDLRLLMDTFHYAEFTGTWRRLFSRVKKHVIWGVLKSVTGMQGKKFKDKTHSQGGVPEADLGFTDSEGEAGKTEKQLIPFLKRPSDGAGEGFVTSVRGLFNSQRRKAKAFVLRTMRGDTENEYHGEWSESEVEFSPFARQLTITKAKKLIRRHTKKFRSRGQKGLPQQHDSIGSTSSPMGSGRFGSDTSSGSPPRPEHVQE